MSVTALGLILFALCLRFAGSATRLVQLVLIAGVFEAGAAVVFGGFGLQPGLVPAFVLIGLVTAQYMAGRRSIAEISALRVMAPLLVLLAYAAATAVVMPGTFAGRIIVWPQKFDGIMPQPVPLAPGQGNVNQVVYLAANVLVALATTLAVGRSGTRWLGLVKAYLLGSYIVLLLVAWELAHRKIGIPYPTAILQSNPGWTIVEQNLGILPRLQGPFAEPSAFAFYMSGVALACAGLCLSGLRPMRADILLVLACLGTLLSTSTTGIATLAVGLPAQILMAAARGRRRGLRNLWRTLALPATAAILVAAVLVVLHPTLLDALDEVVDSVLSKTETDSFSERGEMNIIAWNAFLASGGLGIGWGSTRASSVLPGLLAGAGIVGAIAVTVFVFRLIRLVRRARRIARPGHPALAAIAAFGSALVGQLIAAAFSAPVITTPIFYVQIGILAGAAIRIRIDAMQEAAAPVRMTMPLPQTAPLRLRAPIGTINAR